MSNLPYKAPSTLKALSLRRNFSWTLVGNLVYAACQWGMLMVLAKLGTPEKVGQFTLGLAVTAPVILFSNLQLRAIQATDVNQQYQFGDYLALRLITTVLALLVIVGLVFVGGYQGETALVIFLVGLAKAIESISDVFYGLLQQHERMDRIALSMMAKGIFSLITLSVGVQATDSLVWGVVGLTVAWALVLASYDIPSGRLIEIGCLQAQLDETVQKVQTLQLYWHKETLIKLAWVAFPLGLVMMLISLQTNIPRYFIERYLGQKALGIFAAMAYLQVAGTTIVFALGQSASPRLAKYYATGNHQAFRGLVLKLVGTGMVFGGGSVLAAIVAGKQILALLYEPEYAEYVNVFVWLMVAAAIGYVGSYLGYAITATRAFAQFTVPYALITAVAAGTSYYLIPVFGLMGAAWASCLVSVASCIAPLMILLKLRRYA